jgi:uncharacterized protein
MKLSLWIQYLKECLMILYWLFFKPNTLNQKITSIDPDLKTTTDPFMRLEFGSDEQFKRYSNQSSLLIVIFPLFVIFFLGVFYFLITSFRFNLVLHFKSGLPHLLGWMIGISPIRNKYKNKIIVIALTIFFVLFLLFTLSTLELLVRQNFLVIPTRIIYGFGMSFLMGLFGSVSGIKHGILVGAYVGFLFFLESINTSTKETSIIAEAILLGTFIGVTLNNKIVSFRIWIFYTICAFILFVGMLSGKMSVSIVLISCYVFGSLRGHVWLFEMIWMLVLYFYKWKKTATSLLRLLPPYFDQVIYLPLPFMAKIISLAHQENPLAAEQTINYFITSTNQQAVAHKAMFSIAVATLDRCRLLSDITNIHSALRNRIPQQEPIYGEILENMLGISMSVGSALEGTSFDRQIELLQEPIAELEKLRTDLVKKGNAKDAPLFGPIINRWWQILTDHQAILEVEITKSPRIPQKYLFGNALEPNNSTGRFKGRQDVFREIENISIEDQPPTLLLYGRRRTGKTSTLRYLPTRIHSNLVPLLVDIQGFTSMEEFVVEIIEQMTDSAKNRRGLNFPTIPREIQTNPIQALKRWMTQVESQFPNKRFLLCMDEFERLEEMMDQTNDFVPLNFFRYTMQNCDRWILLFSGSHQLSEINSYWSDCLIGSRCVRLSYLQESEARELIQKPTENFPDIYEPAALDAILQLTRCQPYFVQVICYQIVEMLNLQERQQATAADVVAVIPKSIDAINGYFNEFWTELKEPEQELLLELVTLGSLKNPDKNILRHLIQIEVLEKTDQGGYRFQVPFVHKFVETQVV